MIRTLVASFTLLLASSNVFATTVFDELIDGDLGEPSTPTDLGSLAAGESTVVGSLSNDVAFDADAFSFTVPAGLSLTSVSFSSMTGSNHFLAFSAGPVSEVNPAANLISTLVSSTDVGVNLLEIPGDDQSFGGSGANPPLGPGSYTLWFQETDGSVVDYAVALTTVPEPCGLAMIAVALVGLARRRR